MSDYGTLGLLGGSFDPVHKGHIELATTLAAAALADFPHFSIEECELEPQGPRYTADTLALLRRRNPKRALCWLMGFDSFATLPQWHRWRTLFNLAHFVVGARSGHSALLPAVIEKELQARSAARARELRAAPSGRILFCPQPVVGVSASCVRAAASVGRLPGDLIPESVAGIIRESGAYMGDGP